MSISRRWAKSSRSNPSGNCVEVRQSQHGDIQVRDSKDSHGAILAFSSSEWDAFIDAAKAGEFDL